MSAETTWSISFPFSLDHIVSTEKTECMCTPSLCGPRNIFHPPSTTWPGLASRASIDAVFGQDMMQNSPPSPTTTSPLCCRAHQTDTDRGIPLQRNCFRQTRPIVRIQEQASRLLRHASLPCARAIVICSELLRITIRYHTQGDRAEEKAKCYPPTWTQLPASAPPSNARALDIKVYLPVAPNACGKRLAQDDFQCPPHSATNKDGHPQLRG